MPDNPELIALAPVIIKLAALLGASLMLERLLFFFNKFLNRLILLRTSVEFQAGKELNDKQETLGQALRENELLLQPGPTDDIDPREIAPNPEVALNYKESDFEIVKILPPEEIDDKDASFKAQIKENTIKKEFWMHILGTLLAIAGCYVFKFSAWGFITDLQASEYAARTSAALLEFVFTGIIIGAGSKPINFLMKFLLARKIEITKNEAREENKKEMEENEPSVSVIKARHDATDLGRPPVTIEDIIGYTYDEGDRPERLEHTHRYTAPIDLIVYHHTCFHSDAPFIELIKEFDRKKWLTGYHSVVFKDGAIRTICRWDRFGNHALGHNGHSMGLAFQGNFETNPSVPFSNVNGKMGISVPTNKQLDAGARIIALWAKMHNIPREFPLQKVIAAPKGIMPHYCIASKACPGNNFPHQAFHATIKSYLSKWDSSAEFNDALEIFKSKNRVMPKS